MAHVVSMRFQIILRHQIDYRNDEQQRPVVHRPGMQLLMRMKHRLRHRQRGIHNKKHKYMLHRNGQKYLLTQRSAAGRTLSTIELMS